MTATCDQLLPLCGLPARFATDHDVYVTSGQIIAAIKRLPAAEQAEVIRFAYKLDAERQLTGGELSALAGRLAESRDPAGIWGQANCGGA